MTERIDISAVFPAAYKALIALDKQTAHGPLEKPLMELIRLRASQINGCAYCVDMHAADAKAGGESDNRLYAVAVWQEGPFFTDRERAALALTEAATRLSDGHGVPDEVWEEAARHFNEEELAAVVMAITTINAWNRIGVTAQLTPESYKN
ncbi:carboxymuconolactone decarboxylase family protein [Streptosporangiaceae bacterium NEAU-GS5]|nr:carboxymuconolactone decarboxylase family protein [Streptosporangiaceae bacterium NEAU-GS5]